MQFLDPCSPTSTRPATPEATNCTPRTDSGCKKDSPFSQQKPETCYTKVGISHQERNGIAFSRPAESSVPDVSCQKGWTTVFRFQTLQSPDLFRVLTFRKGDSGFPAKGPCEGTIGTFVNFRDDDPKWADILEQNSQVRSHPLEWFQHSSRN